MDNYQLNQTVHFTTEFLDSAIAGHAIISSKMELMLNDMIKFRKDSGNPKGEFIITVSFKLAPSAEDENQLST